MDDCSAAESAQRQACLDQMDILSQITAELQADERSRLTSRVGNAARGPARSARPETRAMPCLTHLSVPASLQVWADASAASAALARLLELSARLSAAREMYKSAEGEAAEGPAHQMGARDLELV